MLYIFVSAVFGGVIRDVLSGEPPMIFRKEIYAFACLAGALVFLGSNQLVPQSLAMALAIASVITIRILAIKRNWHLPFRT